MSDKLGGILLVIGALFYCLNIYDTFLASGTVGVSVAWASFFVVINIVYTYIFYKQKLVWSMWGSLTLALTEASWLGQIIYYGSGT